MSARDEVLDRIREALSDAPQAPEVPRNYRQTSTLDEDALIKLLTDRLEDYEAHVSVVSEDEAPDRLAELLADTGSFALPAGLDPGWLSAMDRYDDGGHERLADGPDNILSVADLDRVGAVVTGSAVAVAETGTIILDASSDQGRRVISVVPDRHICIIREQDVTGILPEALRRIDSTRPLTWISGPSATSDIELERVEGVHGPRRLDVVIARSNSTSPDGE